MSPNVTDPIDWADLPALFPMFPDHRRWLPLLQRHLALVESARSHTRVTAVPPVEAIRRQYAESLELLRVASATAVPGSLVDIGSGGGYPGLVAAIVFPGIPVHLVEPLQKRARLLQSIARELALPNVHVHPIRAEEAGRTPLRDSAALVTARAVAPLAVLLEYAAPLALPGGRIVLPKGSGLDDELRDASAAIDALCCSLSGVEQARPEVASQLVFAVFEKLAPTPSRYPRRPGLPARRPITK
jgi:16S rRNA (guanine527-N7)-methyltransferase